MKFESNPNEGSRKEELLLRMYSYLKQNEYVISVDAPKIEPTVQAVLDSFTQAEILQTLEDEMNGLTSGTQTGLTSSEPSPEFWYLYNKLRESPQTR